MPAVSQKQQKFFGIVRAIQKGEMAPTTPETAKAAATMKKKDVKDFASTKHKGLPEKKKVSEEKKPLPKQKMDDKIKKVASSSASELAAGNRKNFSKNSERLTKMMKARFEETKYDRYDKEKKQFAKADTRMKFGKFYAKAKDARDRLRPGEVKRYDKKLGKYVSNKE